MLLAEIPPAAPVFRDTLVDYGLGPLVRESVRTLQVNVGKLCNQACHHCHVEAGPKRTEVMSAPTVERVLGLLEASPTVRNVDLTGGAPELNPGFRTLVEGARRLECGVTVRCNLTVLFEADMEWLPQYYADQGVDLVCSLPCYGEGNVDAQRGNGVFDKSIDALQILNRLGYGVAGQARSLDLVYNPVGAFLPPPQAELEDRYRIELRREFGIEFRQLLTITNMPIKRFADMLHRSGEHERYMSLLIAHFNPRTVAGLMCRELVSVGWDGSLYDCDFNQMLEIPLLYNGHAATLDSLPALRLLETQRVSTAQHCFGCTAGAGSGCEGALAP